MIDRTECAWVLNTENSITSKKAIDSTESPWLFSEIATMHVVRRRPAEAHRPEAKVKVAKAQLEDLERLVIQYQVNLASFAKLDVETLNKWLQLRAEADDEKHSLDLLYKLVPEPVAVS
jgi:hypothetical protein